MIYVSLTPQLEALVRKKVQTGTYNNASEVVRKALCLMENQDKLNRLKAAIAIGDEQWARGEVTLWTRDSMDELIREADEENRLGLPISLDVQP